MQNFYDKQFGGRGFESFAESINWATMHPAETAISVRSFLIQVVLLPAAAVWPPLAGKRYLNISPAFRYWANEVSAVIFFFLLIYSEFPIFRAHRSWPRDYGLMVWTITQFAHQVQFMFLGGVSSFADSYEIADLAANVRRRRT